MQVSTTTTPGGSGSAPSNMAGLSGNPMGAVVYNGSSAGQIGNFEFSLSRLQEADSIMLGSFLTAPHEVQVSSVVSRSMSSRDALAGFVFNVNSYAELAGFL